MITNTLRRMRWILGIVAATLLTAPAVVAGPGCLTVTVPATVILPDGSVYEPGTLRLCFDRQLNPVAEIQEIAVAGMPQGLFVGRTYHPEGEVLRPVVVFHRIGEEWLLVGFSRPGQYPDDRALTVRLTEPSRIQELLAQRANEAAPALVAALDGERGRHGEILLAAR